MSQYFPKPRSLGAYVKGELDWSNYATKTDDLKSDVDKLDIDKSRNIPPKWNNLKSKVDKLDLDKLVLVPVDLICKLRGVVKNDFVKKDWI